MMWSNRVFSQDLVKALREAQDMILLYGAKEEQEYVKGPFFTHLFNVPQHRVES